MSNLDEQANKALRDDAAKKAGAHEFISKLPYGYKTLLSTDFPDGVDLSGGQWQKIGIARAFFAQPKLIILDEPTSSLDALAEAEVFANIHEHCKDATVLIVSHRFATVRKADRILVLDQGKIAESGTHEELLSLNGKYAKMYQSQAQGYQ